MLLVLVSCCTRAHCHTYCKLILWVCAAGLGLINSVRTDGSEHKVLRSAEPVVAFTLANSVLIWLTKTGTQVILSHSADL